VIVNDEPLQMVPLFTATDGRGDTVTFVTAEMVAVQPSEFVPET
jgi:hypothetical protein